MTKREWQIRENDENVINQIAKECRLLPLTAKILVNRGMTKKEEIEVFLNKETIPLYDPFLLKDMDKAVERITYAIENKQRICIYGDYDVDGVTSTVMLYLYLCSRGVECEYFIPERISEGYGLSLPVIEKMKGRVDSTGKKHQHPEYKAQHHITSNRKCKHAYSGKQAQNTSKQHKPPMLNHSGGSRNKIFKMTFHNHYF